jgi:hypothetical protein
MSLPALNADGDLPAGVYPATIDEVLARFGQGSAQRRKVAGLLHHVFALAKSTGHLDRLVVFGSFVTAKDEPNDVDVILVMRDSFVPKGCSPEVAPLFDHQSAQQILGASVFWIRPGLLILDTMEAFVEKWQVKRDGGKRGIVEIRQ